MKGITKTRAINKIRSLIEDASSLQQSTGAHNGWRRNVRLALAHVFGSDSGQLKEFNGQHALSWEIAVLESMVNEIEDYWDDGSVRIPAAVEPDSPEATETFWSLIHPAIVRVAKSRFDGQHYSDCVFAAFKEVNSIVKTQVKELSGEEYDGYALMTRAFSPQNPIIKLGDLSTETGKNIQQGYMQLFAGAMKGVRNPNAHGNPTIDRGQAIHYLFLASLLLHTLDFHKTN